MRGCDVAKTNQPPEITARNQRTGEVVYQGPERRVHDDPEYDGPERRQRVRPRTRPTSEELDEINEKRRRRWEKTALEVARDKRVWRQEYAQGNPQGPLIDAGATNNRRGTTITFTPDTKIFGETSQFQPTIRRTGGSSGYSKDRAQKIENALGAKYANLRDVSGYFLAKYPRCKP